MSNEPAPPRFSSVFDRAFLTGLEDVTQLILVRHGEQLLPPPGVPAGETVDPPLSERGREQARLVGEHFSTQHIDEVYASPLRRAYDTGEQIARHHRLTPIVVDDLREVELFRDIPRDKSAVATLGEHLLAGIRERMLVERSWDVYPYSESSHEFRRRAVNAIESIIAANPGRRVAIACHGGVINAYVGHVIGSRYDMFFRPAHTSVHIVAAAEGRRALHSLNDVSHLVTPAGSFLSH